MGSWEVTSLEIQPIPSKNSPIKIQLEKMLAESTGSQAELTGWDNDVEGKKIKRVPRESLDMRKGKHLCYHEGKWSTRDHSDSLPNPDWEFGIAYVTIEHKDTEKDRIHRAIEQLNGTCFANCVIRITSIPKIPADFVFQG